MTYTAQWIANAMAGRLEGEDVTITGSTVTDSREAQPGSLYIARVGEHTDGHNFIDAAREHGAVAAVVTRPQEQLALPQIVVEDATKALGMFARAHLKELREHGTISVVGITGSVGKTTTKDITSTILSTFGPTVAPKKSFNNEVGMPLTILKADETTRYLVLEMGASGRGHLRYLTQIAPPDVAVELAVGKAHLGGFGDVETLARAKAELVDGLKQGGTAVLNLDDKNVANMAELTSGPVLFFSAAGNPKADVQASNITLDERSRPSFDLLAGEVIKRVRLGLVGKHQVSNALAAIATALALGIPPVKIVEVVNDLHANSPHRMSIFDTDGVTYIDDSYNANPDSVRAGLDVLERVGEYAPRRIAVLGEMLELGEKSQQLHEQVGQQAFDRNVDLVIAVGEGAGAILTPIRDRLECHQVDSAQAAATLLKELVRPRDVVLLKGSNGTGIWTIADKLAR